MKEETKLKLYLLAIVLLGAFMGAMLTMAFMIDSKEKKELDNILLGEYIINTCKERYFQEMEIKNGTIIDFKDIPEKDGSTRYN